MNHWTVTVYSKSGCAIAWTGQFTTEDEAKIALENAKVAAAEIGGKSRAEMDPEPEEKKGA
jgi:hypothetical protein